MFEYVCFLLRLGLYCCLCVVFVVFVVCVVCLCLVVLHVCFLLLFSVVDFVSCFVRLCFCCVYLDVACAHDCVAAMC